MKLSLMLGLSQAMDLAVYEKKVKDSYDEACWGELNKWLAEHLGKLEQATKERLLGAKAAWDAGERDDLSEEDT